MEEKALTCQNKINVKKLGHQIFFYVIIIGKNFVNIGSVRSVGLLTINSECNCKVCIKLKNNIDTLEKMELINETDKFLLFHLKALLHGFESAY